MTENSSLGNANAIHQKLFGFHKDYLTLKKACLQHKWKAGLVMVDNLLNRSSSMVELWIRRSDIHIEWAQMEAAKTSMHWAEIIDPLSIWFKKIKQMYSFPII